MDLTVQTSLGPSRLMVDEAPDARAVLWLGHGAGGGIQAPDLAALAAALPRQGITVVRHEQPWRLAGRRVAPRPAALDIAWLEAVPNVAGLTEGLPLIVGGRSAGARVACRTAAAVDATAVVSLAFPLHPPGNPATTRVAELLLPDTPVLVVQGDRDTFGTAATVMAEVAGRKDIRVVGLPGADHGMKVLKSSPVDARGVAALIVRAVGDFINEVVTSPNRMTETR